MPRRGLIGDFEQLVLLAVLQLADHAYGVAVRDEIEGRTGRPVARGAVYTTLDRLERKGLLSSRLDDGTNGTGRRYYRASRRGVAALQEAAATVRSMWAGLESIIGER